MLTKLMVLDASGETRSGLSKQLAAGIIVIAVTNLVPMVLVSMLARHRPLIVLCLAMAFVYGILFALNERRDNGVGKHVVLLAVFINSLLGVFAVDIDPVPYYLMFPSLMAFVTMYHRTAVVRAALFVHGLVVLLALYLEPFGGTEVPYLSYAMLSCMLHLFVTVTFFNERSLRGHYSRMKKLERELATRELSLKQQASFAAEQAERLREANRNLEGEMEGGEQELAALKRANDEAAQLAQAASSDLKEPLRGISAFIQLMDRRLDTLGLADSVREYLHYITDGALRMNAMVEDLLHYSDYKATPEQETVETAEVLGTIVQNLTDLLDREDATLEVQSGLPAIRGQRTQVVQLFQNLISNGIKFKREGVPPHCTVGCELSDKEAIFFVRDNGIGMPADRLKDVFGLFTRLHKADGYEGTGIGLALCRRIVLAAGGDIWAESVEGEGTTFKFSWPIQESAEVSLAGLETETTVSATP